MNEPIFIDRPPRIQPELPFATEQIPNPPAPEERGLMQLLQAALPLLTILGTVALMASGGGQNPLLIIPMVLAMGGSTAFSIYSFRKESQHRAEIVQAYKTRLVQMNKEMHAYHDQQRRFSVYNYPEADAVLQIAQAARDGTEKNLPTHSLRTEARLWERRVEDGDFGVVRLGMGTLPSTVTYVLQQAENQDDPLAREALKLAADSRFVANIPVILSLRQAKKADAASAEPVPSADGDAANVQQTPSTTPCTHALGIAGERTAVYGFVRSLLAHYAVFHQPDDTRIYLLATRKAPWVWTDEMPHCQGDQHNKLRCFLEESKADAEENIFDDEEGDARTQFLEGVRKTLSQRKIRLQDRDENQKSQNDPTQPLLLVVVDLLDAAADAQSPLHDLEADAAISILLEEGAMLGAAVLFLTPERSKIPSRCQTVIEVERTTPATSSTQEPLQKLHFRYTEIGINGFRYVGVADAIVANDAMVALARHLAEVQVRQRFGANVPQSVPFLRLMKWSLLDLEKTAWPWWEESIKPANANWLRVKIGLMSGNKPRTLIFSAKRDGVHGMVAGSTGSGKSELLISLIVGLAVTYEPSVLNFVLVDYKGGGAFKGLDDLPHVVDSISNLHRDGVTRMFTAIRAEMERRQTLNTSTNTKDIVDYRKKGLHRKQPYPFLFIIIDEFAEMIADRPEYKTQLETITRLGRAQGVSLILAAQRPSGVTDQMRSNIKFRICLRVETTGESREMLRREDAAFLPGTVPGRGYLQVGNDEIELIQVAYTGDKYLDPQRPRLPVLWPQRNGQTETMQETEPLELYKAIVQRLYQLAQDHRVEKPRSPWPKPLPAPERLSLETPLLVATHPDQEPITAAEYLRSVDQITVGQPLDGELTLNPAVNCWLDEQSGWLDTLDWGQYALRPVVGLVDDPAAARQLPLVIELPRGHVALFGAAWGKTTFVRTLIISLAATHSPDHLHIYVLDLGGRSLTALDKLPHVGAVIIPDEEGYKERVEQLLRQLDEIVEGRKTTLGAADLPDIYKYNAAHPDDPLPAILVAIDNFIEFKETFGQGPDDVETALDKFTALARQAKAYGIHFVLTVGRLNDLPNQLFSLFTERLTLKLADASDYRLIVGGPVEDFGGVAGRGYVKLGQSPLAFQIAQPFGLARHSGVDPTAASNLLEQFAQAMHEFIATSLATTGRVYKKPVRIDALPKSIFFKQMLARHYAIELDETFVPQLKMKITQEWQNSLQAERADWLQVTLGLAAGNRPRPIHFEAKADGVHGLVAGGTGAGKSELLMTLLVGLALNYDPSVLNFVLVDYKGGGAFQPFEKMPHVVEVVTNLNKSGVRRMFTAINAEMQRRQLLNNQTDTKDIIAYRKRGLHLTHEPYPHLFIIIDEYAEMISDSPEFKAALESITRLGRAQGINLLLAAQRPTGVTDQMRANIKYRLCLRVEEVEISREMLRRSDAAFLPNGMPGRGYLQVGNEGIELIQVAYTGENYPYAKPEEGGRQPKFYDVVVGLTQELLQGERPHTPWPPALTRQLTLASALSQGYLNRSYARFITLDTAEQPTCLNPFVQKWLNGCVAWPGVNWNTLDGTAMRAVVGLVDDPYNAGQLPLVIDFSKGHVVLFGASGWGKTTFLRTLVVSLAATHTPGEFHAHILDLGGRNLETLAALPHVGTLILPDERGYEERVQQLLRELNDIVDARKRKFGAVNVSTLYEYNRAHPDALEAAMLVVVDNFAEFIETFGETKGKKDEKDNLLEAFIALVRQAKSFGLHFIITATRFNVLSNKLFSLFTERLTLRLADADEYRAIAGAGASEIDEIAGRGYVRVGRMALEFQTAIAVSAFDDGGQLYGELTQIQALGQLMTELGGDAWSGQAPLRIDALPKSASYRQVMAELWKLRQDKQLLDQLQVATGRRWAHTASAAHADWLAVTLGIASGNRQRTLHLSAQVDGVHGLVAGGTGSGKSELLMTLIVGLALNYAPDILNFVLIDYKGGGAFKPFARLPHVVDLITNLNKAAVNRMFTAINAEMMRRQQLNADTNTKDIIDYRKKGLHLSHEPYPHLFIIIDEYAEMISESPDFKAALESIMRVGRAQGVNLLLAAQRPTGVSDQMRANIKLRLCLRVEQSDDSQEMLRRPDAAFLPNGTPGRGYLQVGNENIELVQVAYSGEPQPDERDAAVLWPARPAITLGQTGEETLRFFDAVVELTSALVGGQMARKPWPNFLPEQFSLQSPLHDAQQNYTYTLTTEVSAWLNGETDALWPGVDWEHDALAPIVGLVDDPVAARQHPLRFELSRAHLAVFGDAGMGKTSLLRTLIVSLAATHSPDELHVYVLDLGGRNFTTLEGLPHVGAVLYASEEAFEERLSRLLVRLEKVVEERQQLLSETGAANLYAYNARHPDATLPAILVVVDNFAELSENYEMLLETTFTPLVRRSLSMGVTFVASANIPTHIPNKLYSLFSDSITLKQTDPDRYLDIVGRGAVVLDDIPGRGYRRVGRRPLQFHAALPVGLFAVEERPLWPEADELRRLAQHMRDFAASEQFVWRNPPIPIQVLPELVPLHEVLSDAGALRGQRNDAVIGRLISLQPAVFDLKRLGPHFAVVGPPLSGKTTALYTWALSLADRHSPQRAPMILIDLQRKFVEYGGAHTLANLPHILATVCEVEELNAVVNQLKRECALRQQGEMGRELFVLIDNFDDFSEQIENSSAARDLALLARSHGRAGLHFIIATAPESSFNDLRRQIYAANFAVGLQTIEAVEAARAAKRPPGLQDRPLGVGRGFIVKSGQPMMIQIASPYDGMGVTAASDELEDMQAKVAQTLDLWVERIGAKWVEQRATWSQPLSATASDGLPHTNGAIADGEMRHALDLLKRIVYKQAGENQAEVTEWDDTAVLKQIVKGAIESDSGLELAMFGATLAEISESAKGYFPEIEGNGTDVTTP